MNKKIIVKSFSYLSIAIFSLVIISSCKKEYVDDGNSNPGNTSERVIMDTAYGSNPLQKMDMYLPAGRTSSTKTIVLLHGGGWAAGDKADLNTAIPLLRAEWPSVAIVNINYRLTANPTVHHTEIMNDIKSAVSFITSNKNQLVISDTLGMWGVSAGAHLALLYTYRENQGDYVKCVGDAFGPAVMNDKIWYDSWDVTTGISVKDVLTLYNGTTWEADSSQYYFNSPYLHVKATSKPTIIFHGTNDIVVPVYHSQMLHARLNQFTVANEYYEYPQQGHGFNDFYNSDMIKKTVTFFKKYMK